MNDTPIGIRISTPNVRDYTGPLPSVTITVKRIVEGFQSEISMTASLAFEDIADTRIDLMQEVDAAVRDYMLELNAEADEVERVQKLESFDAGIATARKRLDNLRKKQEADPNKADYAPMIAEEERIIAVYEENRKESGTPITFNYGRK